MTEEALATGTKGFFEGFFAGRASDYG